MVSGVTRATGHKMKRFLLLPAAVMLGLTSASTVPVQAGGGDVAAGLIGGLAAGTIIGSRLFRRNELDWTRYAAYHLSGQAAAVKAAGEQGETAGRLEESVTFPPPHGDSISYGAGLMLLRPTPC